MCSREIFSPGRGAARREDEKPQAALTNVFHNIRRGVANKSLICMKSPAFHTLVSAPLL